MPLKLQQLLRQDVQEVFHDVKAANADDILARLKDLTANIFAPFDPQSNEDLWIERVWLTGPQYGYEGFPEDAPVFPLHDDGLPINPLLVRLGKDDKVQDAFYYLFTNRDSDGQKHWNCSTRNGGYQVFVKRPNRDTINQKFDEIRQRGEELPRDVKTTETVMMHLVWPYVFPAWYKKTEDGYSQVRGMKRLLNDVAYYSKDELKPRNALDLDRNYAHYASVYRLFLWLYKTWVMGQSGERHFDFFTQFLAELNPVTKPAELLQSKRALVLYGVPGTGKTYQAEKLAKSVIGVEFKANIKIVQFHPGYSYADFIIGIRPETTENGQVNYRTTKGVLYELAEKAANLPGQKFCLIIDEINRANLAEVLGEAMYCLEYRGKTRPIQLPQVIESDDGPFAGGKTFYLPANLYVIGTMNHADRSITGFDMALRRRFAWHRMEPMTWIGDYLADQNFDQASLTSFLDAAIELNDRISEGQAGPDGGETRIPLNADHQIGDSYFAAIKEIVFPSACPESGDTPDARRILPQDRETLWLYYLRPLLEDYLGNDVHTYHESLKRLGEQFVGA